MKDIQYTFQLLEDFHKLLVDFVYFTSLNLIHQDKAVAPQYQKDMQGLITYSVSSCTLISDFFKVPLRKFEAENKTKMLANFNKLITWMHQYITYAEAVLKKCKSSLYDDRFKKLKDHYAQFHAKYLV